ncbi:MAG: Ig-like domain-containing protein [Lachnospiraceae bacterium]|nr:Ig-like domain-containing protein [Lachnospiraceae bacterium]
MKLQNIKRQIAMGLCICMAITGITVSDAIDVRATESTEQIRYVENLNRGAIAMKIEKGVYLSWRYLGTDSADTVFDIYRGDTKIAEEVADATCYTDTAGTINSVYEIHTIVDGITTEITKDITVEADYFFDIPLDKPADGVTPSGQTYTYASNDASVGDLDGDGEYEIVIKWLPSNAGDNMPDGYRGNVYYDAYEMDGTQLWRIDMGVNIRAGAHYTPFMLYDYDCDGYAEFVVKTADGTIDGLGNAIGDADADWRNISGTIMDGPEYLTVFDGFTGEALDTINYEPARGPEGVVDADYWGDGFGNRSERYLSATAYLDGVHPSVIMARGYYHNYALAAYDIVDKKFVKRWYFDTAAKGNEKAIGQGNHNLATADVDSDGYDEIVYGSAVIDHDGSLLYSWGKTDEDGTFHGYGHGDALHVGDFDIENSGLEIWSCFEGTGGAALRDGDTGEVLLRVAEGPWDTGRCAAGNFISDDIHLGAEFAYTGSGLIDSMGNSILNASGEEIGWPFKWGMNSQIYWCGGLERQNLDRTFIECYQHGRHLSAPAGYNNGTKANATLTADIFGDWREEMILPLNDSTIRVFSTTIPTSYRIPTLMHDTQYRCQVAAQNVGYNQPPHPSFYLGTGSELPQQPDVEVIEAPVVKSLLAYWDFEKTMDGNILDAFGSDAVLHLHGNAEILDVDEKDGNVLSLDGTTGTYAELPTGMMDGLEEYTIEMDVCTEDTSGNYFTFTIGKDNQKYAFLKTMDTKVRYAVTTNTYTHEQEAVGTIASSKGKWMHITVVVEDGIMRLYKDRELLAENISVTEKIADMGDNLSAYLGKSFYGNDKYFKGAFDNVAVYNYAKSSADIASVEMVMAVYEIYGEGSIFGRSNQTIEKGTTTNLVTAVPADGWRFIRWSDGVVSPSRQEEQLIEDFTVTAIFGKTSAKDKQMVAFYDFENIYDICVEDTTQNGNVLQMQGNATIVTDDITGSRVLKLNGNTGTYAEFQQGMFDGMDEMTIFMDVKSYMTGGNFFTFTVGADTNKYMFLKVNNKDIRNSITKAGYKAEQTAAATYTDSYGEWIQVTIVLAKDKMQLYVDGKLAAETAEVTTAMTDLGENLQAYLGKSFFSGDAYFNGCFDDLKIYNYAMSKEEVQEEVVVETVSVDYKVHKNHGEIRGDFRQTIKKGSKTTEVEAIPAEGYRFVRWSDGNTNPKRNDVYVDSNKAFTAVFAKEEANADGLVAYYDFENVFGSFVNDESLSGNLLDLYGEAVVIEEAEAGSKVLSLNGTNSTYAALPTGLFDGMDSFTIQMKIKPVDTSGNFFTFTVGANEQKYVFLKTTDTLWRTSITLESYRQEKTAKATLPSTTGKWREVIVAVTPETIRMYSEGKQIAEQSTEGIKLSDMGENLQAYFGRSFFSGDTYFNGYFDDIKLYNRAMTAKELEQLEADKKQEAEDIAVAKTVMELIAAIDEVTYSDNSKDKIETARTAYVTLSDVQKSYVTNLSVLEAAEAQYAKLKAEKEAEENEKGQEELAQQKKEEAQKGTISVESATTEIAETNTDKVDVAGSTFAKMKLKATGKNRSIKLSWSKQTQIDGYLLYGAACGETMNVIADIPAAAKIYTVKGLGKGKYYKFMLVTYKNIYGEKRVIDKSVTVHAVTKGGKYNNPTKVTVKKAKVMLKKGKKIKLASALKIKGKSKTHISKFRYELSKHSVISINKKGQIKGKEKGSCDVYVYGQNGVYKKVRVVVK